MAGTTPKLRVELACQQLGTAEVIRRCLALLGGDISDENFVVMLGGSHSRHLLDKGVPSDEAYWLRVWALRGLLWAGPGDDVAALRAELRDESWRVREMACKIVARHLVGDLLRDCAELRSDAVSRVRLAAARSVVRIIMAGA